MPKRERYVWVCTNRRPEGNPKGSCAQKGSEALQVALKDAVAIAGMHKRVRVMTSGCLDLCWVGCSIAVMPDGTFLGRVTPEDVPTIVEALGRPENVAEHPGLRDKVVRPEEFDDPAVVARSGKKEGAP